MPIQLTALVVVSMIDGLKPVGKDFTCKDKELADQLIANGSAKLASDSIPDDDGDDELGKDADFINAKINGLLSEWLANDPDQKDKALWTQKGEPRNAAIDDALGINVTKEQVAPIWNAVKAHANGDK